MALLIKALAGAVVVVIIQLLSQTKSYFIAGLVPLFPTFTLISHYVVGSQHTNAELKQTILFGMVSVIPYFVYLVAMYVLIDRFRLMVCLLGATLAWGVSAAALIALWGRL